MKTVGLSSSHVYCKLWLYKFLPKYVVLKKYTLASHYFKANFKLIKKVCMDNLDLFGKKDW